MLMVDGHESHLSAQFEKYCADNMIKPISLPSHSSHLTQPLDVGLYSPLKRAYGDEINLFIRASINHITKTEFFLAFKKAHDKVFTKENMISGFRGAGLVPLDPAVIISKLDIRLSTPSPLSSRPSTSHEWVSQTPSTLQQAVSQSNYIKNRISAHQGSSPSRLLEAVSSLGKGAQGMALRVTILEERVRNLEGANIALSKRRRAKKSRVQKGGALSIEESQGLLAEKEKGKRPAPDEGEEGGSLSRARPTQRRCTNCGKTGHNKATCQVDIELDKESDSD